MLYIECRKKRPTNWGINGEDVFPSLKLQDIVLLQADGEELEIIVSNFSGIPRTKELSQVWVGVFAQQIFANLLGVIDSYRQKDAQRTATALMEEETP